MTTRGPAGASSFAPSANDAAASVPLPADAVSSPGPDLRGRVAVVTGAAGGIGRACAARLRAAGAEVRLVDRDAGGVAALADAGLGTAFPVDLTDLDAAAEVARGADIVVNNAGVQTVAPIEEFPPERFSLILRLMVEAPFRLVRAALPHMYERGWGRIVNISSVHGLRASAYKSAYVTAKHGLEGFSKVAAIEGAPHGVTSNCISPGYVRTPLVERQIAEQARAHGIPEDEVVESVLLARTPLKRLIEPDEVAAMAVYLCGPDASFVNGASLTIDGAWSAN
ncbi:3-hydroxybutyrate dehydrogenase [Streptomonospora nanhaiensis]|uniref:3-hydroxybutyrate dehydrogenase n=1 Tax=Streptomonospora nanhaiensis TaxID=1323731 RepID=A0A853BSZ0_9ACTN|nr:3-hydroxybutyrate dehydrogenase [Streptomonospora nanhaiensis]MBV2362627.1 3-hydroxybutyrate dehydrogenase [Streptomonospora nanhaiensis]MBX9387263.1 3-hydroxybutyrate dehydrogenase [Streptomonospora nanhaiensis]NYI98024.1 3-hydroxybutyrate dehydrogenase [Streptomonospora nanhaiensis]